jgi:hypothetical protein
VRKRERERERERAIENQLLLPNPQIILIRHNTLEEREDLVTKL